MSKLHPDVIEAGGLRWPHNEECARRVINALAEHMPEEAVDKALSAWFADEGESWTEGLSRNEINSMREGMRAAIAAFLKSAGGTE